MGGILVNFKEGSEMTLKKLFATAASAALLAGGAHAATAALGAITTDDGAGTAGNAIAGLEAEQCVANEANLTNGENGIVEIAITASGAEFASANGLHTLAVTVTGATLNSPAAANFQEVDSTAGANLELTDISLASSTTTTANYTFRIGEPNSAANDVAGLALPLTVNSTGADVKVTLAITSENNTTQLSSTTLDVASFVDGVTVTLGTDVIDSQVNAGDTDAFIATATAGAAAPATDTDDTVAKVELGTLTTTVVSTYTAACVTGGANPANAQVFATNAVALGDFSASGTIVVPTQTNTFTNGWTGEAATALGNAFAIPAGNVGATEHIILTKTAGTAAIGTGTVTGSATITDSTNFLSPITVTGATLDALDFTGTADNTGWRWVGGEGATAQSVFRCTKATNFAGTESVQVTIDETVGGTDGTYTIGTTSAGPEYVFNGGDVAKATATGAMTRTNIDSINFVGGAGAVTCDRIQVNASGDVSPFGNQGK